MKGTGMAIWLAGMLLCSQAPAQESGQNPAPVQPKTANGVNYLCGGVGQDESDYIKQQARNGGLLLTFAARDGSYLANVHVDLADHGGKPVLQVDCDGPMLLLLNLPAAGAYRVRAESGGKPQDKTVSVHAGSGSQAVFVWEAGSKRGG
jgi:hypothetical protein